MHALRAAVDVQSFTNRLATTIRRQNQLPRLPIIERHRRRPGLRSRQCPMQRGCSDVPGRRHQTVWRPPKPAFHNEVGANRGRRGNGKRSDPDRPDPAISSADNAAGTQELLVEIERMQIYGEDMPCSDIILAELRTEFRNSGESQNRVGNPSRHFFSPSRSLRRSRGGARQFRPDIAWQPGGDLGMDHQIAIADNGGGILRQHENASCHGQGARSPSHRGGVSV